MASVVNDFVSTIIYFALDGLLLLYQLVLVMFGDAVEHIRCHVATNTFKLIKRRVMLAALLSCLLLVEVNYYVVAAIGLRAYFVYMAYHFGLLILVNICGNEKNESKSAGISFYNQILGFAGRSLRFAMKAAINLLKVFMIVLKLGLLCFGVIMASLLVWYYGLTLVTVIAAWALWYNWNWLEAQLLAFVGWRYKPLVNSDVASLRWHFVIFTNYVAINFLLLAAGFRNMYFVGVISWIFVAVLLALYVALIVAAAKWINSPAWNFNYFTTLITVFGLATVLWFKLGYILDSAWTGISRFNLSIAEAVDYLSASNVAECTGGAKKAAAGVAQRSKVVVTPTVRASHLHVLNELANCAVRDDQIGFCNVLIKHPAKLRGAVNDLGIRNREEDALEPMSVISDTMPRWRMNKKTPRLVLTIMGDTKGRNVAELTSTGPLLLKLVTNRGKFVNVGLPQVVTHGMFWGQFPNSLLEDHGAGDVVGTSWFSRHDEMIETVSTSKVFGWSFKNSKTTVPLNLLTGASKRSTVVIASECHDELTRNLINSALADEFGICLVQHDELCDTSPEHIKRVFDSYDEGFYKAGGDKAQQFLENHIKYKKEKAFHEPQKQLVSVKHGGITYKSSKSSKASGM
jgi:hypothetical protein